MDQTLVDLYVLLGPYLLMGFVSLGILGVTLFKAKNGWNK